GPYSAVSMPVSMDPRGPRREPPVTRRPAAREARGFPARASFATMGLTARPSGRWSPVTAQYPALSAAEIDLSDTEFWGWPLAERRAPPPPCPPPHPPPPPPPP